MIIRTVGHLQLQEIDACTGILLRVVSAGRFLDLPIEILASQPLESRLEGRSSRVFEHERGVDTQRVTNLQGCQVALKRMTQEDGMWGDEWGGGREKGLLYGSKGMGSSRKPLSSDA